MKKLLEIYKNKIITNIKEFSDDYYYFYNYDELFGISKSISKTEYELLKLSYQEKVIYNKDSKLQKLYEFLYDNNSLLPKKTKLIMYPFQKEIDHIVTEMLESIFDITILDYKDIKLGFIKNLFDVDIFEIFDSLTIDSFSEKLYTYPSPDPDLIIRTAGEQRLSNFLLWQSAYSEFWFTDVLWPDFSKKHLERALHDFSLRTRKFGGK